MKNLRLYVALAVLCPATAFGQITVTAPVGSTAVKAADDFATRAFQDPWDMSQKTDVGPFLGSNDAFSSNWKSFSFSGGLFTGTTAAPDAQLWLLDTGSTAASVPAGRIGTNFPIDANTYKVFAVRMTVQNSSQAQVLTWPGTIYDSSTTPHVSGFVSAGTGVYFINMDLTAPVNGRNANWTGLQRTLRFQPTGLTNEPVSVDWARLVPAGDSTSCQPIRWTGPTDVDIYLDTDGTFSNNFYGLAQSFATNSSSSGGTKASAGCPVVPGAFNFYVGALSAGTYRVFIVPVGNPPTVSNAAYSPGSWTVNDIPTLKFTSPTSEGSDDDFATVQLGDPWDMNKVTDVDRLVNVNNPVITTLNMEAPDGTPLLNQRVFQGTSTAVPGTCNTPPGAQPVGDPQMVMLDNNVRGKNKVIDTDRYRLLTVEMGIPNAPRDLFCGSVVRMIWRQKGDLGIGSVSGDILFNSRAGANLLDKFTVDMKSLIVDQGTGVGSPNWNNGAQGGVDIFRFDPHEFGAATPFYVKRIKLADFERARNTYTIQWTYSKPTGFVDLFYTTAPGDFTLGTQINVPSIDATLGQFVWSIPANLPVAGGKPYYIYAKFTDGMNPNQVFAPQPLVIDSNFSQKPRLVLSRQTLNFGAQGNTTTATDPQTVRLTFVGAGAVPCWTISNSNLNFTVTPSSGTGNQTVTVSLVPQSFAGGGSAVATFTVSNGTCGNTMLNPGQQFVANFNILAAPAAPTGAVDTPPDGSTVIGSMGMTGWAVDDIGITFVKIYRVAAAGEPADGLGRVFIGDANLVEGARPDIEASNPTRPFNYRAGWGYLVLTNFLPNQGNGTFVFQAYAYDKDFHETLLGQRTVIAANSAATEPFGAIDTPGQGATVSGASVANFGWVLTKGPNRADPPGGGTVSVVWDGAIIGNPGQWTSRGDLSALFSATTYPGIVSALGVYVMDTTAYTDGVHTLSWVVVANNGQAAGIGSRYVTTVNGNSLTLTDSLPNSDLGRTAIHVASLDRTTAIRAGNGYATGPASLRIAPDPTGLRTVYGRSLDRLVVDASRPGARAYEAYQVVAGTLRALPTGASFDNNRGVLYWQPGPGFVGDYDFVVVRDGRDRVPVRVVLNGTAPARPANRLMRGLFTLSN